MNRADELTRKLTAFDSFDAFVDADYQPTLCGLRHRDEIKELADLFDAAVEPLGRKKAHRCHHEDRMTVEEKWLKGHFAKLGPVLE